MCVYVCRGQRPTPGIHLSCFHLISWASLSLNLKLADSSGLTGYSAPGAHLFLLPKHWNDKHGSPWCWVSTQSACLYSKVLYQKNVLTPCFALPGFVMLWINSGPWASYASILLSSYTTITVYYYLLGKHSSKCYSLILSYTQTSLWLYSFYRNSKQ